MKAGCREQINQMVNDLGQQNEEWTADMNAELDELERKAISFDALTKAMQAGKKLGRDARNLVILDGDRIYKPEEWWEAVGKHE